MRKLWWLDISSVVAGRNKEVGQLGELIFCEGRLVLAPVVLVGSLETLIRDKIEEQNSQDTQTNVSPEGSF